MKALFKIIKKIAAVISAAAGILAIIFFGFRKNKNRKIQKAKSKAQEAKDKKYDEIKKSNGASLVINADNAVELQSIADKIKADNAERIQDKLNEGGL